MDERAHRFFGGLLWYLEIRNWAFEKMQAAPHGSSGFDLQMHHSLFFVNLMSAVDHVGDYLKKTNKPQKEAFVRRVRDGFDNDDYDYVRELRNSVVHRGLDPTAAAHSDQRTLHVLCPATVENSNATNTYSCSFKYLIELAEKCRAVIDPAITDELENLNLLNPKSHEPTRAETMNAIDSSTAMPDWTKMLSQKALDKIDFADVASKVAQARVDNMRRLLAH